MSSTARSSPKGGAGRLAQHPALPLPVDIRPMRSARCFRLRIDERRSVLKLTCPARASKRAALAWAADQSAWVEAQLRRLAPGEPFAHGAVIPIEGADVELIWLASAPRTPRLAGARLVCGGPEQSFAGRVERFLRKLALDRLSLETAEIAQAAGLKVRSVSVGDADTRWGSCSSSGRIRYSWRLILAPPEVRRFVVAHEVAHLVHMNHGPDFRKLERQLYGSDPAQARALLASLGNRLKRIGRW